LEAVVNVLYADGKGLIFCWLGLNHGQMLNAQDVAVKNGID